MTHRYVRTSEVFELIDSITAGRLDHEALTALQDIAKRAEDAARTVATELFDRRRRAAGRTVRERSADIPFQVVGALTYDPATDSLESL